MNAIVCLTPACNRVAKLRGLCRRCYASARRAVAKGQTDWEHLEAIGATEPPTHMRHGPIRQALARAARLQALRPGRPGRPPKAEPPAPDLFPPEPRLPTQAESDAEVDAMLAELAAAAAADKPTT